MSPVPPLEPPQRLVRFLHADPDAASAEWLAALPGLLADTLRHWDLTAERVVEPGGRTSLVVLVRLTDGRPATLKLLAPPHPAGQEAAALSLWDGWGAARLLRTDEGRGALLLERLHCEVSLRSLAEAKAMLEAASALRRLWIAPPDAHGFATVADHTSAEDALLAEAPPEVRPLVDQARETRDALLAEPPEQTLLHGDFRQGAVLAADAERAPWLAVGAEPLVGEHAYDLARLTRDRLHDLMASAGAPAVTRRRIASLADSLEVDRDRLRGWTVYRAVSSGVRQLRQGARQDGEALLEFAGWA
jgi:streptomycin 6-kinase